MGERHPASKQTQGLNFYNWDFLLVKMHLGTNIKGKALVDNYHRHHHHYHDQQIIRGFAHHLDDGDLNISVHHSFDAESFYPHTY